MDPVITYPIGNSKSSLKLGLGTYKKGNRNSNETNQKPQFILDCCRSDYKLPTYNGFQDKNLMAYFANNRLIKHLEKVMLVI